MNINTQLRTDMLTYFLEVHTTHSFKQHYPQYNDEEVKEMRQALMRSDDLRRKRGLTRSTLYQTTDSGRMKIGQ